MIIREIRRDDAENFIRLIQQVEAEAEFMMMEAGERKTSPEEQSRKIEMMKQESNQTIFLAETNEGKVAGYLVVIGGSAKRMKHCAYLVAGILKEHRGKGIGTALFLHMEEWAIIHNISRLELTVVTENEAGVALYKKSGFEIEGIKRNALRINGTYYNEYYMSKLI